jgi:cytochrome c biogenesis factor
LNLFFDSKKFDFLTKTGSTFFQTVVKKLVQAKYVTDHRLVPFLPGRVARPQPEAQSSSSKGVSYNNNLIHNNMLYVYCILFYIFHVFCLHFFIKLDLLNSIYGAFCFLLISNIFLLEKKNIFRNFNKKSEKANIYRQGPRAKTLQHQATLKKLDDFKIQNAPTSLEMKIAHSGLVLFISGILLSNTFKFQFTEQLHSGSMIRLGPKTICCLRSIDHSFAPTFHSICANLLVFESNESDIFTNGVLSTAYGLRQVDQKLEGPKGNFVGQQTIESNLDTPLFNPSMPVLLGTKLQAYYNKHNSFLTSLIEKVPLLGVEQSSNQKTETELSIFTIRPLLCLFPEKRFYFSNSELTTTKVAIHSNLFTDVYGLVGTGSFESGWFTTIMKLPFIFCIWLGFMFAVLGGAIAIKKQLQKSKVIWH